MSKELFKCLLSHEFYTNWGKYVTLEMFSRELQPLVNTVQLAHDKYKSDLTTQELYDIHTSSHPTMTDSSKALLKILLDSVDEADNYNPDIARDVVYTAYKADICRQIIELAVQLESGVSTDWDKLEELRKSATSCTLLDNDTLTEEVVDLDTITDIVDVLGNTGDYEYNIPAVQAATTGLYKRSLTIVGARPEAGKTALWVSFTCAPGGFIHQGANVHIWRNEERYEAIAKRALSSILQVPSANVKDYLDDYKHRVKHTISGKLSILKDSITSQKDITDVRNYIEAHPEMDVLVIDQIDNLRIKGQPARNDVKLIEEVYATIREYAIRYDIAIIAITQAGAEADNKLYWGYTELYGSKTGKAATGDVIFCVGYQRPQAGNVDNGVRALNYSKNKHGGTQPATPLLLNHTTSTFTYN